MNKHPNKVKNTLLALIQKMSQNPTPYVRNPGKDFTRTRKLPFETIMKFLISMGGNSICKELLDATDYAENTATTSAFIQQRDKILPSAFEMLFREFTETHSNVSTYRGYRLLAADGSNLYSPTNPNDSETYMQNQYEKGYNLSHLNALYDLQSKIYVDALVQPCRHMNEGKALSDMVERSQITEKTIIVADRNYESYNNFVHIERKGWNYVIRVKDLGSTGILSGLRLPSGGEFDICINKILTRKQTNEVKENPNVYKFMPSCSTFDFLDKEVQFFPISFRIVRIKIGNFYETLITNLDTLDFPPDELKEIYRIRWGIETSFRELKYSVGLTSFHAKKQEYIVQEIFARLIMYNFAEMITSYVVISQADTKHACQVNFTVAIHICRYFLRLPRNALPPDVEALIRKSVLPVRTGRKAKRMIQKKGSTSFLYRVA